MIYLPYSHPSISKLLAMGVDVSDEKPKHKVRSIVILNLMPQKQEAEEEYYIAMNDAGIDVEIVLAKMSGLTYKTTPQEYMDRYYTDIADIMSSGQFYDGMIVTGAPLEQYGYEDVRYWRQLYDVYRWSFGNVRSTLNICWGAFASLRIFFGIKKYWTKEKMFGVFPHVATSGEHPLLKNLPAEVMVPISRHITFSREELLSQKELTILLDQDVTGPELAIAWDGRHIFANGHMEYLEGRLRFEYERDLSKGEAINMPVGYFVNDDPAQGVNYCWRDTGIQFYKNWLVEYVDNEAMPILPLAVEFMD